MDEVKFCTKCKLSVPLCNFAKKSSWCKTCMNTYAKFYREQNKEKTKEKNAIWYKQVGYSLKKEYDLIRRDLAHSYNWIEYQFNEIMAWDNYGIVWEIDHVVPCSSFDLTNEDNKKTCFHWTNLRPLCKRENALKSDKICHETITKHEDIVKTYICHQYQVKSEMT